MRRTINKKKKQQQGKLMFSTVGFIYIYMYTVSVYFLFSIVNKIYIKKAHLLRLFSREGLGRSHVRILPL